MSENEKGQNFSAKTQKNANLNARNENFRAETEEVRKENRQQRRNRERAERGVVCGLRNRHPRSALRKVRSGHSDRWKCDRREYGSRGRVRAGNPGGTGAERERAAEFRARGADPSQVYRSDDGARQLRRA